jgi:hypothetical protein
MSWRQWLLRSFASPRPGSQTSRALANRFSAAVVEAIKRAHPGVFDASELPLGEPETAP